MANVKKNVQQGKPSQCWLTLRQKMAEMKVSEALLSPRVYINNVMYTVLKMIGEGGYSMVYEVYDTNQKTYALKVVDLSQHEGELFDNFLLKEIIFLEKLKHCDLVIQVYDYELKEEENKLYVLMEKGERDLHSMIYENSRKKNLTPTKLRYYWEMMLESVAQVHKMKIIHTDLKPGNFLLVEGRLKVIDFGMALELSTAQDLVKRDSTIGTRDYMAPEAFAKLVIEEGVVDFEATGQKSTKLFLTTDVWSLGIILYQAVFDRLPYATIPGGKLSKIKALQNLDVPVDIPDKNIDPLLLDVIKRCLDKDPEMRPSVADLLVHPYLYPPPPRSMSRPKTGVYTCSTCRRSQRQMKHIYTKRTKKDTRPQSSKSQRKP